LGDGGTSDLGFPQAGGPVSVAPTRWSAAGCRGGGAGRSAL